MARFFVLALALCCATAATGAPLPREHVPAPLQPWVDWVLRGHENERCPTLGSDDTRNCTWPARLTLAVEEPRGDFSQRWFVLHDRWVPLPGDARQWPQDVHVDGKIVAVTPQHEVPGVYLGAGAHDVTGMFTWDAPPELLQIPPATGLVALVVGGQTVALPNRDAEGRLWIRKRDSQSDGEARLDIAVHRHVSDDIPLRLTTQIDLKVSGRSRETLLGRALPAGFVPLSLEAPVPARIEPDGRLRVQLRPGNWSITLVARHDGPVTAIQRPAPDGPWSDDEVWVFEAHPALRLANVEGVPAVDPQQTLLPEAWRALPAYLLHAGDTFTLAERRRGDADPAPDQLSLERTWWLDFDGRGFTARDTIRGALHGTWRLEMLPPMALGRVGADGRDQTISTLGDAGGAGVEIRQGTLALDADSRIDAPLRELPVVGWSTDVASMSGQLHLPPGWRLLHASGVDAAWPSWVSRWTLWDLFLVLVMTMAIARLWGPLWGAVALVTLGLSWHEVDAPHVVWALVLVAEGLRRVVPPGRFQSIVQSLHAAAVVGLIVVALPFVVRTVRVGIYPALEHAGVASDVETRTAVADEPASEAFGGEDAEGDAAPAPTHDAVRAAKPMAKRRSDYSNQYQVDLRAKVGTGPGVPTWSWRQVALTWRGPVEAGQTMRLYLVPPWLNLLLGAARFALVGLLVGRVLRRPGAALLLPLVLSTTLLPRAAHAEFPPPDLLDTLRGRLLEAPECAPNCATIPRLAVTVSGQTLRLRLDVHAAATTALPLPGGAQDWIPNSVVLDAQPADGLSRAADGALWLFVGPGAHQVFLEGPLAARETIRIPLPLRPHRVDVAATDWTVDGVHEDGAVDDALQLTRTAGTGAPTEALEAVALPPLVRVERVLRLGLAWDVSTTVSRLSPLGTAIVVDVPLLAGEAVTSGEIRTANGKVNVSLGPQADSLSWESTLQEQPQLHLAAPAAEATSPAWVEVWRVDASPVWHLEAAGIPIVQAPDDRPVRQREWRPWPGEQVTLTVTRPTGVAGQTLTIDRAVLSLSPGSRATDATLVLGVRSSQGVQHAITLPEHATLQAVTIDGLTQPIRQEGQRVVLPITPATRELQLTWRQSPGGIGRQFSTPAVQLGMASVNNQITVAVPSDRWVLAVGGPRLGPAVLFWSTLLALLPVAVALARSGYTPLGAISWFLLGIGLTQIPIWTALVVAGWLLALGWRARTVELDRWSFNVRQVVLIAWTVTALGLLFWAIQHGLLGAPEMQIAGNGSDGGTLRWYYDRAAGSLPTAWIVSVPLLAYRLAMLAWALWLATALLGWLRWGWECFSAGGLWRPLRERS